MTAQTAALNLAADGIATNVTHLSLHSTGGGGAAGGNELTGGSYARRVEASGHFSYATAGSGTAALTGSVVFQGPGSTVTVVELGFWNGSTWLGSATLSASKSLGSGDTLTITAAPITVSAV